MVKKKFEDAVGDKARRKLRAGREGKHNPLSGFGLFGIVGWSVAVPALLGILLGLWLDRHHPGRRSWTLTCFIAGLMLGCWNAWYWVRKESKKIDNENE